MDSCCYSLTWPLFPLHSGILMVFFFLLMHASFDPTACYPSFTTKTSIRRKPKVKWRRPPTASRATLPAVFIRIHHTTTNQNDVVFLSQANSVKPPVPFFVDLIRLAAYTFPLCSNFLIQTNSLAFFTDAKNARTFYYAAIIDEMSAK